MSWGIEHWGWDSWGGVGDVAVQPAPTCTSERSVLVSLSSAPMQRSEVGSGDALNPRSWRVSRAGVQHIVMSVTRRAADQFELHCLLVFDSWLRDMLVEAALRDGTGVPAPISSQLFSGCRRLRAAPAGQPMTDVANPFFRAGQPGDGLVVRAGGDYDNESGEALLRKLIIRRLRTAPGGLFHLRDYGVGLHVKSPLRISDLTQLRLLVEQQLKQEPEIAQLAVRMQLTVNGVLTCAVAARTVSGKQLTASVTANPDVSS